MIQQKGSETNSYLKNEEKYCIDGGIKKTTAVGKKLFVCNLTIQKPSGIGKTNNEIVLF